MVLKINVFTAVAFTFAVHELMLPLLAGIVAFTLCEILKTQYSLFNFSDGPAFISFAPKVLF